jgi:adenine-specific DNA methylase
VRGSSERQLLADNSIDLVVTDPPYFDDVQYSELATVFLAWAHATGLVEADIRPDTKREAVPNRTRGTDASTYERLLTRIFSETRRVLRPSGVMILTFHNTESTAWIAFSRALRAAGFSIRALAVVRSENDTDHAKRGRRGFTKDLVLECTSARDSGEPAVVVRSRDEQDRELLAIGRAMSAREPLAAHTIAKTLSRFTRPRVAAPIVVRQAS